MKEIKAIFRPSKLLEVTQELQRIPGLPGLTVSEVRGIGRNRNPDPQGGGGSELFEAAPQVRLEVVVHDEMVAEVVDTIQKYTHTGRVGDGKIFVSTVDDIVKIRTNERGSQAL